MGLSIFASLMDELLIFREERDWQQFHSPKNLACSLSVEANELLELFQWTDDCKDDEKLKQEIADVAIYLLYLCHDKGINLHEAISEKIQINGKKYPVCDARGNSKKYDDI